MSLRVPELDALLHQEGLGHVRLDHSDGSTVIKNMRLDGCRRMYFWIARGTSK